MLLESTDRDPLTRFLAEITIISLSLALSHAFCVRQISANHEARPTIWKCSILPSVLVLSLYGVQSKLSLLFKGNNFTNRRQPVVNTQLLSLVKYFYFTN